MGHKSGLRHAGAVGKPAARDVGAELREGTALDIAELCERHAERSVKTLVDVQRSRKATATAKVAAANSILDRVAGRPATQEREQNEGGLTIVVNQLYLDGKPEVVEIKPVATEAEIVADDRPSASEIDLHGDGASIVVKSPLAR